MITVQPNVETDPDLLAAQVSDACREGYAWAQQVDRTEAQVIGWAAVVLRDGPTRMGWTPEQTRLVAQHYLQGWLERPTMGERLAKAASAIMGAFRGLPPAVQAAALEASSRQASTEPPAALAHFTMEADGRVRANVKPPGCTCDFTSRTFVGVPAHRTWCAASSQRPPTGAPTPPSPAAAPNNVRPLRPRQRP